MKAMRDFPRSFENFFDDRFAFRQQAIQFLGELQFFAFQTTATPYVLVGPHNWLFFRGDGEEFAIRHWPLYSQSQLQDWGTMLEQRRAWLAKRNIKFLLVLTPTKSSIYPELVPAAWKPLSDQTRSSQLCEYLQHSTKVDCLNLQPSVWQAKSFGRLYFKTDTHWNPLGAYFGYKAMITHIHKLFPHVPIIDLRDVNKTSMPSFHGDLLGIAGLGGDVIEDIYDDYKPKLKQSRLSANPGNPPPQPHKRLPFATEQDNLVLPSVYFMHDSFLLGQMPFISESFRRAYFDWRPGFDFDTKPILSEKPDLVVQEMTERYLTYPLPINPPALRDVETK